MPLDIALITFGSLVILGCIGYCTYRSFMESREQREREWNRIWQGWQDRLQDAYYKVRLNERRYIWLLIFGEAPHASAAIVGHFLSDWQDDLPRHIKRWSYPYLQMKLQDSRGVQRIREFLFRAMAESMSPDLKHLEEEYFERNPV